MLHPNMLEFYFSFRTLKAIIYWYDILCDPTKHKTNNETCDYTSYNRDNNKKKHSGKFS